MAYYVINYSKLRIWEFVEYEKMIYLDGDIQVYDNIYHLFDLPNGHFYTVMDCSVRKRGVTRSNTKLGTASSARKRSSGPLLRVQWLQYQIEFLLFFLFNLFILAVSVAITVQNRQFDAGVSQTATFPSLHSRQIEQEAASLAGRSPNDRLELGGCSNPKSCRFSSARLGSAQAASPPWRFRQDRITIIE